MFDISEKQSLPVLSSSQKRAHFSGAFKQLRGSMMWRDAQSWERSMMEKFHQKGLVVPDVAQGQKGPGERGAAQWRQEAGVLEAVQRRVQTPRALQGKKTAREPRTGEEREEHRDLGSL